VQGDIRMHSEPVNIRAAGCGPFGLPKRLAAAPHRRESGTVIPAANAAVMPDADVTEGCWSQQRWAPPKLSSSPILASWKVDDFAEL
jgi:hypothetical protein